MTALERARLEAGPPEASPTGETVLLARKEVPALCGKIPGVFGSNLHLLLWHLLLLPAFASSRRAGAGRPFLVGPCCSHSVPKPREKWLGKTTKKNPRIATAPAVSGVPVPPASHPWGCQSHRQWMGPKMTCSKGHLQNCTVPQNLMHAVPVPAQPATRAHTSGKDHSLQRLDQSWPWVGQRELRYSWLWSPGSSRSEKWHRRWLTGGGRQISPPVLLPALSGAAIPSCLGCPLRLCFACCLHNCISAPKTPSLQPSKI